MNTATAHGYTVHDTITQKDEDTSSVIYSFKKKRRGIISRLSEWLLSKSLQTISADEGVEKREPSYTAGANANWYSHYGEQCGDSLKNTGTRTASNSAIPLLGIHTEETRIVRDTCTPMFIASLFTIARTGKQPKCSLADIWIRKLW